MQKQLGGGYSSFDAPVTNATLTIWCPCTMLVKANGASGTQREELLTPGAVGRFAAIGVSGLAVLNGAVLLDCEPFSTWLGYIQSAVHTPFEASLKDLVQHCQEWQGSEANLATFGCTIRGVRPEAAHFRFVQHQARLKHGLILSQTSVVEC